MSRSKRSKRSTETAGPTASGRRLAKPLVTLVACTALTGATALSASGLTLGSHTEPSDQQGCVQQVMSGMSTAQRVGQLFMVGVSSTDPTSAQLQMISDDHLGGVYLDGNSSAGVSATKQVTDQLEAKATGGGADLWVGTDQEGGNVQRLTGSGFSTMPTALDQGKEDPSTLQSDAKKWGGELKDAGLNLNLAPVLGTVPEDVGTSNQPIGKYEREYGYTPSVVSSHGVAYLKGEQSAGIQTTAKHFPGLGRADGNTDTAKNVKDTTTTRHDAYLQPFQDGINAGAPLVMVSSAIYTKIDPNHVAAFSPTILQTMLRGDLGFKGVIISDSMSAAAVSSTPAGDRAVDFLTAGGDVILTGDSSIVPTMINAVTSKVGSDSSFADTVNSAVEHVLDAKYQAGLLSCSNDER